MCVQKLEIYLNLYTSVIATMEVDDTNENLYTFSDQHGSRLLTNKTAIFTIQSYLYQLSLNKHHHK